MSFSSDINSIDGFIAVDYAPAFKRIRAGIILGLLPDEDTTVTASPAYEPMANDLWELERLNPSTCNLRFAHLVCEGKPTGELSLAQPSGPFSRI